MASLPPFTRHRLAARFAALADNPIPPDSLELGELRFLDVHGFRIVYRASADVLHISMLAPTFWFR